MNPPEPVKRRKLSLSDKVAILTRQALCGLCGKPLGTGPIEWHHQTALAISGDDDNANIVGCHKDCHSELTFGPATKTSNRDSQVGMIAHVKRAGKKEAAFRARLLTKGSDDTPAEKPRREIQSRGFRTRPSTPSGRPR